MRLLSSKHVRHLASLSTLFFGALFSLTAFATSEEAMNVSQLTDSADVIVAAKVMSSKAVQTEGGIATMVELSVDDSLKGAAANTIIVEMPGGSLKSSPFRVGETVAGLPRVFINQQAIFFLNQASDASHYTLTGFTQGFMAIQGDVNNGTIQSRATGGETMKVDAMKKQILDIANPSS